MKERTCCILCARVSVRVFVTLKFRTFSSNPSLMSRENISVVGADYRMHYPRLYALTDEGVVVSKSNYRVTGRSEKKKKREKCLSLLSPFPRTDTDDIFTTR